MDWNGGEVGYASGGIDGLSNVTAAKSAVHWSLVGTC